jgi:geranylgeranyl pyrophosphate synthase
MLERAEERFIDQFLRTAVPLTGKIPKVWKGQEWKATALAYRERGKRHLRRFLLELSEGQYGSYDPLIIEAITYSVLAGGKRARIILVYLVHDLVSGHFDPYWLGQSSLLAELPHRGSLIEDDIDDHATQRDGRPAVHIAFGANPEEGKHIAMAAANLLYESPRLILERLPIPDATRSFLRDEYQRLTDEAREGQRLDLLYSTSSDLPTLDEYMEMCRLKCAAFEYAFVVGATLGQASQQNLDALREASRLAAVAFQLTDDVQSYDPTSEDFLSDLMEGKPTAPIIIALSDNTPQAYEMQAFLEELWGRQLNVRRS